jgi:integrase
MFAEIA